ncbi:hypothetical protein XELAEV_18014322mg [Xenopus laevis]|uniref:Uncharacterized protein n=1 Tax=Xenopus laevis TaxID=8355 RepID=A0A974DHV8_XENLA|nr:hypothetical protein XELAEV_18014322mg [Xenopus laevis]
MATTDECIGGQIVGQSLDGSGWRSEFLRPFRKFSELQEGHMGHKCSEFCKIFVFVWACHYPPTYKNKHVVPAVACVIIDDKHTISCFVKGRQTAAFGIHVFAVFGVALPPVQYLCII